MTRDEALALDAADPLAPYRARFAISDPERIYVDGNSLGFPPAAAEEALAALHAQWRDELVGGWEDWIEWPLRLGDLLGAALLGAQPGETLVCDSVTVNLYKLARAALTTREGAIVVAREEFPTDRYVAEGLGRELRWVEGDVTPEAVAAACAAGAALVICSHLHYRSGARADMARVSAAARDAGALMLWDLSHSVGSIAIDLPGAGADLAVGCTYKYVCGGPGAPAFLWVRKDLIGTLRSPIQGWFGQADQFAMGQGYTPRPGIERFLAGTPPVVALAAVAPGVRLLGEAGMDAVEEKEARLTDLAIALFDEWLAELGFRLDTPRQAGARGAHVALAHDDAWRITRALIERARVVPDFRAPDVVRLGFPALTTSFADVYDALDRLRALVQAGTHLEFEDVRRRVT